MKEYKNYGIMLSIIAILSIFAYKYVSRPVIVEKFITNTVIDTAYIQQPPQVITKYIQLDSIVLDTIYFETNDTVYITDKYQDSIIYRVVELKPSLLPVINTTTNSFNEGMLLDKHTRLRLYVGSTFDSRGLAYTAPTLYLNTNRFNFGISKTINNNEFKISAAIRIGKD